MIVSLISAFSAYSAVKSNTNPNLPTAEKFDRNAYSPFSASKAAGYRVNKKELGKHFYLKLSPANASASKTADVQSLQLKATRGGIEKILSHENFKLTPVYTAKPTSKNRITPVNQWFKLSIENQSTNTEQLLKQISALAEVDYVEREVLFAINPDGKKQLASWRLCRCGRCCY